MMQILLKSILRSHNFMQKIRFFIHILFFICSIYIVFSIYAISYSYASDNNSENTIGRILSYDIMSETVISSNQTSETTFDTVDVYSLSPYARFLAPNQDMRSLQYPQRKKTSHKRISHIDWKSIIRKASQKYALDERLIAAIIRTESSFDATAISPKGAQGAMQLMLSTQREMNVYDPFDAEANVLAGCAYLRQQLDRFGSLSLALAAYNAGPSAVIRYKGIPPFEETQKYIRSIFAELER